MKRQEFIIAQQFTVGDIKVDTEARLDRTYTRLLLDAFVPYQEAMLAYLDELIAKHDPQVAKKRLNEAEKQSKKKFTEWMQTIDQLSRVDKADQKKITERLQDLDKEQDALRQISRELLEKLDLDTRSQTILHHKKEDIVKLLKKRQEMISEGTWEKIGGKDRMSSVFSLMGDDEIGFGFSKISLQASPINDIYDWMTQYHPDILPPGDPFPVQPAPPAPKKAPVPKKKELPPQPSTEFLNVPDDVTASIRTFLALRRPGYTLRTLLDRSQDNKRAWLGHLTRTLHDETVEHVSDVIIELEPRKYMTIQNVQDSSTSQPPQDTH